MLLLSHIVMCTIVYSHHLTRLKKFAMYETVRSNHWIALEWLIYWPWTQMISEYVDGPLNNWRYQKRISTLLRIVSSTCAWPNYWNFISTYHHSISMIILTRWTFGGERGSILWRFLWDAGRLVTKLYMCIRWLWLDREWMQPTYKRNQINSAQYVTITISRSIAKKNLDMSLI